jgi:hypothetical protein
VIAALIGWAAVAFDLYGPMYSQASCDSSGACTYRTGSLLEAGLSGRAALFMGLVVVILLGVAAGGVLVAAKHRVPGVLLLTVCGIVLLMATVISGLSIGPTLLPSDLVAIITLALALTVDPERAGNRDLRGRGSGPQSEREVGEAR